MLHTNSQQNDNAMKVEIHEFFHNESVLVKEKQ